MKIMTTIEKVIYLRKKYKISQEELVRGKVARSYLAMVETGTKPLGKNLLNIIVENFNTIFEERGIKRRVTKEELLKTKEEQITEFCDKYLELLNNDLTDEEFENYRKDIEEVFFAEYSPKNKTRIFKKIAEIFYNNFEYNLAKNYYLRTINDAIQIKDYDSLSEILSNLSRIYNIIEEYSEFLDLQVLLTNQIKYLNFDEKLKILFNFILLYIKTENYEKALEYISILKKDIYAPEDEFELELLKAECLINLGKKKKANSIYRGLLIKFSNTNQKLICNSKLALLAVDSGDNVKLKYYLRKAKVLLKTIEDEDNLTAPHVLDSIMNFAEIYRVVNSAKDAIRHYEFVLKLCDESLSNESIAIKAKVIKSLLSLYGGQDFKKVKELEKIYFDSLIHYANHAVLNMDFIDFYYRNNHFYEVERFLKLFK